MANYEKLLRVISKERLEKYESAFAQKVCTSPLELYKRNSFLCESFYSLLLSLEVGLRNSLHGSLNGLYGTYESWLLREDVLHDKEKDVVKKVIFKEFTKKNKKIIIGKLVSELNFGFWTALLDRKYEQVFLLKIMRETFPYMKNSQRSIKDIRSRYHNIRKLRNRIMHYEPIWHMSNLKEQHDNIVDAIRWMEPELLKLVDLNRFDRIYSSGLNNG